ncbi:MAG: alpha/beta hydrolase fold domain-containing protein [Aestuariivirga sp.]|uniref:alpha/beta hydrolase fold domain-containing protein n=1 Tax=Aestuariivirga sp. TaxID=2650926 RepID=UPI003017B23E
MTTAPFDAETRAHLEAQAKDAGPWDPAWPLARLRQAWEDQCKRVRARRPDRLMVEDLEVDTVHVRIYPAVGADPDTKSYLEHANSPALSRAEMIESLKALLGPRGSANWSDPLGAPNTAQDVSGLPPTFITVAVHDPLHDDGVIFAEMLKAAGVPVALREEPTLAHSYWRSRHHSKAAMAGFKAITQAVRHLAHEGALQPY